MARSLKRFRLFILSLALISFILGLILSLHFKFPDKLPFMLISEALTVILYSIFAYGSKKEPQNHSFHVVLRTVLAFFTVYAPLQALKECSYNVRRDYDQESPGIHTHELISCLDVGYIGRFSADQGEERLLPMFRLFRARSIITLTVCALIVVEIFSCWSDEASGLPQDGDAASAEMPNDVELREMSDEPQKMAPPPPFFSVQIMVLSINWLRILIVCLALISFIFGMILREELEGLDGLTLLLVSEALTAILYSVFVFNSKRTQIRMWRIFLRSVMGFLMIYGSVKTLSNNCKYSSGRDYIQSPGFSTFELIECDDGLHYGWYWEDGKLLRAYRYYRARCIIALTVCALVLVELLCYWRSTEGSRLARDDALTEEAREDVELENVALEEPQKMEFPDPPHPTAA
ncbi:hypothetical protein BGZ68_008673 [Mortierella alpina]|nr:hypothetical protein BGZ68_008673 [Mortierella alpina]